MISGQSLRYNTMYNLSYVAYWGDLSVTFSQVCINGNNGNIKDK